MSTNKSEQLLVIGMRLAEERNRLDYNQSTLSDALGKSSVTQYKYEAGITCPTADYLLALDKLGADIYYIITGRRLEALKEEDEVRLLGNYRNFDEKHKAIILNLVEDISQSGVADPKLAAEKKTGKK
jgi:transcriptional regulator with XRE-family HTH domain